MCTRPVASSWGARDTSARRRRSSGHLRATGPGLAPVDGHGARSARYIVRAGQCIACAFLDKLLEGEWDEHEHDYELMAECPHLGRTLLDRQISLPSTGGPPCWPPSSKSSRTICLAASSLAPVHFVCIAKLERSAFVCLVTYGCKCNC